MRALRLAPLLLLASLLRCTDFPQLQSGVCGNAVVETGEDCDTYPISPGTYCRPPGSAAGACRLDCTTGSGHSCPSGWGCGTDGICRQPTGTFREANGPVAANAWRLLTGDFDGDGKADLGCVIDGGIDVMLGQTDRTVSPVAYPAYTLPGTQVAIAELTEHNVTPVADIVFFASEGVTSIVTLTTSSGSS